MKKVGTIAVLLLAGTSAAYADVARLTIRFGGGCVASETGSCTIRIVAEGTDLDTEGLWIYTGTTSQNLGSSRFRVGNNEHKDHVSPRFDP